MASQALLDQLGARGTQDQWERLVLLRTQEQLDAQALWE